LLHGSACSLQILFAAVRDVVAKCSLGAERLLGRRGHGLQQKQNVKQKIKQQEHDAPTCAVFSSKNKFPNDNELILRIA
jgi:hypothetical protein